MRIAAAIVVTVVAPFVTLALLPSRSVAQSAVLALSVLAITIGPPALVVVVVRSVLREAREARANAAAVADALGWTPKTRAGRPAFVGDHRGHRAYLMATVRLDPSVSDGRKRFGARPVVRVGLDAGPVGASDGAPAGGQEGVDLPPRGVGAEDVIRALDGLLGEAGPTRGGP